MTTSTVQYLVFACILLSAYPIYMLYNSSATGEREASKMETETFPLLQKISSAMRLSPEKPRLSIDLSHGFRFGNRLFDVASLYGIADTLGRQPVYYVQDWKFRDLILFTSKIMPGLFDQLLFINDTRPAAKRQVMFQELCCLYEDPNNFKDIRDPHLHLSGRYFISYKYFHHLRHKLLDYLKPPEDFPHLPHSNEETAVLCIHVRRTDFLDGARQASNEKFIRKATDYIVKQESRNTTRRITTVLFGDDVKFEKSLFSGAVVAHPHIRPDNSTTIFVSTNKPEQDLLYASQHCDVVFMSAPVSTFGWWMAYLSRHNYAYYVDIRNTNDISYRTGTLNPHDFYVPTWKPLKMEKDGRIVEAKF